MTFLLEADFDPESYDTYPNDKSDSDDGPTRDGAHGEFDGREHYEEVAPSKLRRPVKPVLGKRYASSRVRREDLLNGNEKESQDGKHDEEDSAEEDPFAPVSEGSEEDPFTKDRSSGSESEDTPSNGSYSGERKRMKTVSGSVPDDEDEEIESEEAFGEDDAGKFLEFKFLGSRKQRTSQDLSSDDGHVTDMSGGSERVNDLNGGGKPVPEDESEASSQLSEDDSDEDIDIDLEHSEASSDLSNTSPPVKKAAKKSVANDNRAALKALLSSDTAAVASSLSAAASADAKKGRAVKAQYQTFDRLLDARIKLQKGLTATNSITIEPDFSEHKDAIQAAEEAALSLWNTITSLRHSFAQAQSQTASSKPENKRKRPTPATTSTTLSALWSTTQSLSSSTLPHHRTTLNKWSAKVRATNPIARETRSRLLNDSASQNSITNVIDGYLATETEKLIAQSTNNTTSTPKGTPSHTNQNPEGGSQPKYDDTPFYQSLLRDLITSRSTTNTSSPLPTTKLHPPGSNHKKHIIDTKASKGRKIRYTVNEKLQDFMAAEGWATTATATGTGTGTGGGGGATWSEGARDEFFRSLMGGRGVLDEGTEDDEDGGGRGEVEALRLFRS